MDIVRSSVIASFVVTSNIAGALADEWTSPDGVIAVSAPDAVDFQQVVDPPEPFMAFWMSNDETLRLGVMKSTVPSHIKIVRSSVEEGFAETVAGSITASSAVVKNGHEIWIMTVKGSIQGTNIQSTQAIAQYNGNVYKVMAIKIGDASLDQATINTFVNSIDIKTKNSTPDTAPVGSGKQRPNDHIDLHNLSKRIGGAGGLLLFGVIIWLLMRRGKNKP